MSKLVSVPLVLMMLIIGFFKMVTVMVNYPITVLPDQSKVVVMFVWMDII
jgi:hypothetical protein